METPSLHGYFNNLKINNQFDEINQEQVIQSLDFNGKMGITPIKRVNSNEKIELNQEKQNFN